MHDTMRIHIEQQHKDILDVALTDMIHLMTYDQVDTIIMIYQPKK